MAKSGVYEIAKYIPLKVRRQMVAAKYKPSGTGLLPFPECADGRCPMGWLPDAPNPKPMPSVIGRTLRGVGLTRARTADPYLLVVAARKFTEDWDAGRIKDLRKALDVPKAAK